jgi:hypothetical protein
MKEFIDANGGLVAAVVLIVVSLNAILMGISDGLGKIAAKTETKVDDALAEKVGAVANFLKKIIDIVSANRPHN